MKLIFFAVFLFDKLMKIEILRTILLIKDEK